LHKKIEMENTAWKADGMDLQYVRFYAVDNKGRKVLTATGALTFDVSGAARLIAVDNGDHVSDDLFACYKKYCTTALPWRFYIQHKQQEQ
jgi:beta-galactosidase